MQRCSLWETISQRLFSLVAEMQQTFMNTSATYEETDDDMEFQKVSALKKKETIPNEAVQKQQSCRNLLQMQKANQW